MQLSVKKAGWLIFCLLTSWEKASAWTADENITVTHKVFFDVSIGEEKIGRIVLGLFGEDSPKTVKNFVELAKRPKGKGYDGTIFHRVIKDFMIQGGDFVSRDGYGFESIYGGEFEDENFFHDHYGAGFLNMANRGPNTNGCQFSILTVTAPWLDGKHVVFGKVLEGFNVVKLIENTPTNERDKPLKNCLVTKSGELPVEKPFTVDKIPLEWDELSEAASRNEL